LPGQDKILVFTPNFGDMEVRRYRHIHWKIQVFLLFSPLHCSFFLRSPVWGENIVTAAMLREMVWELCSRITKEQPKLEIQQCYQNVNMWTITFHLPYSLPTGHGAHETYRVGIVFLLGVRWPGHEAKRPPSASVKVKNRNMWCVSMLCHRRNGCGRSRVCLVLVARSRTRNFRVACVEVWTVDL
jgi:hypothetical protein